MKSIFIIGPSGSGKSTLSQYLSLLYKSLFGQNSVVLVNLDPANPSQQKSSYDIDMNNLITLEDVMQQYQIGPNGAMLYSMDFLYDNKQWLVQELKAKLIQKQPYLKVKYGVKKQFIQLAPQTLQQQSPLTLIFDLPGQIQLYLHNANLKSLISHISLQFSQSSLLLQLFDSTFIYHLNDFVSLCMMSLVTMINFQMPHFNLLSKIDVVKGQRPALGMLNQYFDVTSMQAIVDDLTLDQNQIIQDMDDVDNVDNTNNNMHNVDNTKDNVDKPNKNKPPSPPKRPSILNPLSTILDQYNQVSFLPCSIYQPSLIKYLILQIQKTFNTHQFHKSYNNKYKDWIKEVDKDYAKEEIITTLENQLFREEEEQIRQEENSVRKVLEQLEKQMDKSTHTHNNKK